jgi:hypothetical protein
MALAPPNRTPASSIQWNGSVDTLVGSSAGSPDSETRYLESVSEVPVSFEMDRKSTSTSLMWHCGLLWTITSWSSGKGDFVTELRDHAGEVRLSSFSSTTPPPSFDALRIVDHPGPTLHFASRAEPEMVSLLGRRSRWSWLPYLVTPRDAQLNCMLTGHWLAYCTSQRT